eukprot:SAG31_NODE_146_length_22601_cov_56.529192_25_plen_411_part_00
MIHEYGSAHIADVRRVRTQSRTESGLGRTTGSTAATVAAATVVAALILMLSHRFPPEAASLGSQAFAAPLQKQQNPASSVTEPNGGLITAVCFVGELRVGIIDKVAQRLRQNIVEPNHADVFMCLDGRDYDEMNAKNRSVVAVDSLDYGLIAANDWQQQYPTLKRLRWRPSITGYGNASDRYRRYWPQFKGWECCHDLMTGYENENGFRYDFVIKARPDVLVAGPVVIPDRLLAMRRAKGPDAKAVSGQAFFHPRGQLMCDELHVATRAAAQSLFTAYVGLARDADLSVGTQQCCGGMVNQEDWFPPSWCGVSLGPTSTSTYWYTDGPECAVDRWLRTNAVTVAPDLHVPGNGVRLLHWPGDRTTMPDHLPRSFRDLPYRVCIPGGTGWDLKCDDAYKMATNPACRQNLE